VAVAAGAAAAEPTGTIPRTGDAAEPHICDVPRMTDIATVRVEAPAPPKNEGLRWLRRHLAWERTMQDCVERALDAQLDADPGVAADPGDQSIDGTSAHSRSSS
jgi:hypothetical protein